MEFLRGENNNLGGHFISNRIVGKHLPPRILISSLALL